MHALSFIDSHGVGHVVERFSRIDCWESFSILTNSAAETMVEPTRLKLYVSRGSAFDTHLITDPAEIAKVRAWFEQHRLVETTTVPAIGQEDEG